MHLRVKTGLLVIIAVLSIAAYLFVNIGSNWSYALARRGGEILAIVLTGGAIGYSTLVFQTITNNRILTPSIIGLDSLYLLIQTVVIFFFGSSTLAVMDSQFNFVVSVGLMILFAGVLYKVLFKREGQNIYFLLLIGLIFGILFDSIASFMQVLIDPNEFLVVQDRMFASINNVNRELLFISTLAMLVVIGYSARFFKFLDVLSLGRDHAVNLGIDYDYVVKRLLLVVAVLVSIATALIGPITFLGLLVVNVAYEFLKTYRHRYLIAGSVLISVTALAGGQFIVKEVFTFSTTLSVIVNFIGGIYFIYLLLKENRSW
ncbi:iron chelate uptake ABC transporter family permease subunit [Novibacillus thermophilus]|uniref:Iron ABC transporter permease n=1 Tax=Novibacillus thermophilus TaxID=1471761 RepID=A0A1U9K4X2_9BACL|nr:iron chelate uptake ABC transporter family permease subunit [Novibacillus thermophilus]AQS55084.1 iron ABC transporter permease [Novibacillus thermophilus]